MPSVDDVINRLLKHSDPETRDDFPLELEGWFARVVEPLLDGVPEGTWGVVQHGKELAVLLLAGDSGASLIEIGAKQESISVTHLGELTGGVYAETHTPEGIHLSKSFTFAHPRILPPGAVTHLGELTSGVYAETYTREEIHLSKSFTFSHPRIPPPGVLEFQPLEESEWEKCDVLRALLRNWSTGSARE